jgi:hypothetical protein
MNFLIGAIEPQNTGVVNPNDVTNPNDPLPSDNDSSNNNDTPEKKTNWYLYGILGILALAILMNSKK